MPVTKMIGVCSEFFRWRIKRSRLKPVHSRHVHIQQDDREILVQQAPQGFLARSGLINVLPQIGDDRLHRQPFVLAVIHDQDVGRARCGLQIVSRRLKGR